MQYPPVTVIIITYNRPEEIRRTISALRANLLYPGLLQWHLADDASAEGYLDAVCRDFPQLSFSRSVTQRKGWGANANAAIRACETPYYFLCEDDYVAKRPFDVGKGVLLMESQPTISMVRYDGLEGHTLDLHLREVKTQHGGLTYLSISKTSPHLNVYSNRPHLCHRERFHAAYGFYPEGLRLGLTEEAFAHHILDTTGGDIAILESGIPLAFDHIGKSYQLSSEDAPH